MLDGAELEPRPRFLSTGAGLMVMVDLQERLPGRRAGLVPRMHLYTEVLAGQVPLDHRVVALLLVSIPRGVLLRQLPLPAGLHAMLLVIQERTDRPVGASLEMIKTKRLTAHPLVLLAMQL